MASNGLLCQQAQDKTVAQWNQLHNKIFVLLSFPKSLGFERAFLPIVRGFRHQAGHFHPAAVQVKS